jgi:uridine kinase
MARAALEVALDRKPTLHEGRVIAVDGPAGAGKSTLAAAIFDVFPGCRVVTMDDLYDGWEGLPRLHEQLDGLLGPLSQGVPGSYRRYDWTEGRYAETVVVDPVDLLVLEGVGAGSLRHADLITVLVWVNAREEVALARALARDGAEVEQRLRQWQEDEADHFARERTRERADLVHETG